MFNLIEWMRLRKLERLVDIALEYGIYGYFKSRYSFVADPDPELWIAAPNNDEEKTTEKKRLAARKAVAEASGKSYYDVRRIYRAVKNAVKSVEVQEKLYNRIEAESVTKLRTEAMVILLRAGKDNHPAFAMLAEAATTDEVAKIRREVERVRT